MQRHFSNPHEESADSSTLPTRVAVTRPQFSLSTYQPADGDMARIRGLLEKEGKSLQKYKEEVANLEQKLRQAKADQLVVEHNVSTCLSALSVSRRVPVEIWEHIFCCYVSLDAYSLIVDYDDYSENLAEIVTASPTVTLDRVCQNWRRIIRGRPALWSTISLALAHDFYPNALVRLRLHLEHSQNHPLQVRLQYRELTDEYEGRDTSIEDCDFWKLISSHTGRWQSLILGQGCEHLPQVNALNFISLTSLIVESPYSLRRDADRPNSQDWLTRILRNGNPPSLKFVEIAHLDQMDELPLCHELTRLQIRRLRVSHKTGRTPFPLDFLHTLEACSDLRSLSFNVNFDDRMSLNIHLPRLSRTLGPQSRLGPDVTLSRLESLTIHDTTPRDKNFPLRPLFCSSITVPSIVDLELICCSSSVHVFFAMITRSSPPLARLKLEIMRIQGIRPSELPVLPFLESFSSTLTHLEIEVTTGYGAIQKYKDFVDPFIEGLFSKLQETEFLPLLSSITLVVEEISITNEVVDAVLKIASQRQAAVVPLRSFSLTRYTHQRIGPAFRKLATEPQEMMQRIRELHQRFRVSVNFEERDYKNAEERTMRINTGYYISSPWEDSDEV